MYDLNVDMMFIGTGQYTAPIQKNVIDFLHQFGISVESMSTVYIICIGIVNLQSSAAANFNFLHDDKERVAVALLPEQPSPKTFEKE